ncbi:MAG: SHOCT domain-containing protein [Pseudomonadota bacterium]
MKRFVNVFFIILAVMIGIFVYVEEVKAQYQNYCGWGMGPGMMGWGGTGWLGPLFMLLFWVLIIVLVVLLIRWLLASGHVKTLGASQEDTALEILKKRYAKGEINKEEFEEKKKDLN